MSADTPAAPAVPRRPAGRYDDPRPLSRAWALGVAVVFAVLVSLGVSSVYSRFTGASAQVVEAETLSDSAVRLVFVVSKPADRAARCALRAQDTQGRVVGRLTVTVPAQPAGRRTTRVEHVVPTSSRAALADVLRCRLEPAAP